MITEKLSFKGVLEETTNLLFDLLLLPSIRVDFSQHVLQCYSTFPLRTERMNDLVPPPFYPHPVKKAEG